jgi:hypothetical protein
MVSLDISIIEMYSSKNNALYLTKKPPTTKILLSHAQVTLANFGYHA